MRRWLALALSLLLVVVAARPVAAANEYNYGLTSYGGTWGASMVWSPQEAAEYAFDGNENTIWGSGQTTQQYIWREWPRAYRITSIRLLYNSPTSQTRSWRLQYRNELQELVTLDESSIVDAGPVWVTIPCDITSTYFRAYIDQSKDWTSLGEFQLIGPRQDLGLTATATPDHVSLRWEAATPPYSIQRDGQAIGTASGTSYDDVDYPTGASVTYTVSDSGGITDSITLDTPPGAPVVAMSSVTTSSVTLGWGSVTGATGYSVYRDGSLVGQTSNVTFTDGNLAPETSFVYSVRAYNSAGEGRAGTVIATTAEQPPPPAAPQNLRLVTRGADSLRVAWDAIPGVGGYKVYLNGALYSLTGATNATITGLAAGTQYTVTVQAYTGIYDGEISSPLVAATVGPPDEVTDLTVIPGPVTLSLSWRAPATGDPPTSYRVYLDDVYMASTSATSYSLTGLAVDTQYVVGVAGVNEAGEGALVTATAETSSLEPPGQVTGLRTVATVRTITLDWHDSPEADEWRVYIDAIEVARVAFPACFVTGLAPETDYLVEVRAVNPAGIGDPAAASVRTKNGRPTILKVTPSGTGYILTYTGPDGPDAPDEYRVFADDELRTSAYIPSQWPDTDMGWSTGSTHAIRLEAVYGHIVASDTATVTAYVALDPVEYPPPASLFEGVMQDWSQVILLVTALSVVWMVWDWWRGLMRRDPFTYYGDE